MARSMNKVFLVGNVGNDPEVKSIGANGNRVANFSLATSREWIDKGSSERKEKTEWHRCTVFGPAVEIVEKYVKKGDRLTISGRIEYSDSEKDGVKVRYTTIVCDDIVLDRRQDGGATGGGQRAAAPAPQRAAATQRAATAVGDTAPGSGPDDDLPF